MTSFTLLLPDAFTIDHQKEKKNIFSPLLKCYKDVVVIIKMQKITKIVLI